MVSANSMAKVAAAVGDPGRSSMLQALLDGRALTATELAYIAGVAAQTASGHLRHLTEAGLLKMAKYGRFRYYRLAMPRVAELLEMLMLVATETKGDEIRHVFTGPKDIAMRAARTCFNHLAGRLGVALADSLINKKIIELTDDGGAVTAGGAEFLVSLGIPEDVLHTGSKAHVRLVCRPCLDWSERRLHVAGKLGAALCLHAFDAGWVRHCNNSRIIEITPTGHRAFHKHFQIEVTATLEA